MEEVGMGEVDMEEVVRPGDGQMGGRQAGRNRVLQG